MPKRQPRGVIGRKGHVPDRDVRDMFTARATESREKEGAALVQEIVAQQLVYAIVGGYMPEISKSELVSLYRWVRRTRRYWASRRMASERMVARIDDEK